MADNLAFPLNGNGATVDDYPITFTTKTPDNVDVTISGSYHIVFNDMIDATGHEHLVSNLSTKGLKGIDTLGRSYVSSNTLIATYESTNGAYNQSGPFSFLLIGKGSAPNLLVSGNFHETITPDGTLTAFVDNFKTVIH